MNSFVGKIFADGENFLQEDSKQFTKILMIVGEQKESGR